MFLLSLTFPSISLVTYPVVFSSNSKSYLASVNVNADDDTAEIKIPILPDDNGVAPFDPDKFNPVPSLANEDDKAHIKVPP